MKVRAYIRVAKNGYKAKIDASTKSSEDPIFLPSQYNRPSPKLERLAILSHNIELSKKDNRFLNVNDPDQYRHN